MHLRQLLILIFVIGFGTLQTMDKPSKKGAPRSYDRTFKAPVLQPEELKKQVEEAAKNPESAQSTFLVLSKTHSQQLQTVQDIIFNASSTSADYTRAKQMLDRLVDASNPLTKSRALYLRGIIKFNGIGQPVDFISALQDFRKILNIPHDLEIKNAAESFIHTTQAMIEITDAVEKSNTYADALLETNLALNALPQTTLTANLLDKVIKIIIKKYPNANLVYTARLLAFPNVQQLLQELIDKDPLYYQQGSSIIENALKNKNRDLFFYFFNIPSLAYHIVIDQDTLIKALKNRDYDTLSLLAEAGADFNYVNLNGENPLITAILQENPELVHWILEHGADPLYQIKYLNRVRTPMEFAREHEYPHKQEILRLLSQIPPKASLLPKEIEPEKVPPYHSSRTKASFHVQPLLIGEHSAQEIQQATARAYQATRTPTLTLPQEQKRKIAEVASADQPLRAPKDPRTAVTEQEKKKIKQQSLAAYTASEKDIFKDPHILDFVRDNDIPALEKLINAGADINAISGGENALSVAIKKDNKVMVEWLLNHGANPQMPLNRNDTPFLVALRTNKLHSAEIINSLLIATKVLQAPSGRILLPKPPQEIALPLDYNPETHNEISSFTYTSPEAEYNWLRKVALENPDQERRAYAEYRLGNMFFFGNGIQRNLDRALLHYQRAAGLATSYVRTKALIKINELAQIQSESQGP